MPFNSFYLDLKLNVILNHLTPDENKFNNKMNGLFFDKLYRDINMKNKTLLLKGKIFTY
jgi:hypothetical protein